MSLRVKSTFALFIAFTVLCWRGLAADSISNERLRVAARIESGEVHLELTDRVAKRIWADGVYVYSLELGSGKHIRGLADAKIRKTNSRLIITGRLAGTAIQLRHELFFAGRPSALCEQLMIENSGTDAVNLSDVAFGFQKRLGSDEASLRWVAVPFRRQADGKLHDYSSADLVSGRFSNSNWANDACVAEQELVDAGKLRSEAWAWTDGRHGLLVAKYNSDAIEHSVASVEKAGNESSLRFGGAGLSLYREPRGATMIAPGGRFVFGVTRYLPFDGDWPKAYELYRTFLAEQGHGLPRDYRPPLNWNELFDVGWYHSNREQLFQHYTRDALLREAAKARELGCDLLYLDPGWEICEGTTLWDEQRLGKVSDFSRELKHRFNLKLGYRTIGRVYRNEFPSAWHLRRKGQTGDYRMPFLDQQPLPEPVPLMTADGRRNLALLPQAKARASSVIAGYAIHTIGHLNDGYYNNPASWISAGEPSWIEIDLGATYAINEIALGSEHSPRFNDRAVSKFEVRVAQEWSESSNLTNWQKVFAYDGKPVRATQTFSFPPVSGRWVRVLIQAADSGSARIDELEVYEATPHADGTAPVRRQMPTVPEGKSPLGFWEVCTQSREWQEEKLKRILAVTGGGVDFMMFDEFDWRGPCYDAQHGHPIPSTPEGHVRAVYGLVEAMRARYPHVLVEAHDPVWPWGTRYLPTYFRQGFDKNRYQENWGFEFMWNPIDDLRSGRALCLYYYNLGCSVPLYDHITMEADNDSCLSFWWYASTVRHLGVGGKKGLNSSKENESRFAAYKKAVAEYNRLRPFYARGRFVGIDETTHVHLHPDGGAAVVNVFNLTDTSTDRTVVLNPAELGLGRADRLIVEGASFRRDGDNVALSFALPPLTPAIAVIRKK